MLIPNKVKINGDSVVWKFSIIKSAGSPCTATVTVPVFPGLTFQSITSSKAGINYSVPTITWPTSFTSGENVEVNITYTVTNIALLPTNLTAAVAFVCDTNAFNNTITDTLNVEFCPPSAGAVDDIGCACGNVSINDTPCSSCTSQWILEAGSEVNLVVNSFDQTTGAYNVTYINPNLAGSFRYNLWCINCSDGNDYDVSNATVNLAALFSLVTTPTFVKEDFVVANGGSTVSLATLPLPGQTVFAYRNGLELPFADFFVVGTLVTFNLPFFSLTGTETITIHYFI